MKLKAKKLKDKSQKLETKTLKYKLKP